jgi:hypothetical protein
MKKTLSVSVAAVEREKHHLLHEIETLRSVSAQVEALLGVWVDPLWGLRAEINGRVHVLQALGLIDAAEAKALHRLADAAQAQCERVG